jgi:hypothetical protein
MRGLIAAWRAVAIAALAMTTVVSCLVIWWFEPADAASVPTSDTTATALRDPLVERDRLRRATAMSLPHSLCPERRDPSVFGPALARSEIRLERSPAAWPPSHGSSCLR